MNVRVVIVDDQLPLRTAARLVVESTDGFDVVGEAETGEDSIEIVRELEPDVVLMDVNLPGMNGLEATRRIVDERPGTVVLVLSTYEESGYDVRAVEAGAAGFIPKSQFDPERLAAAWETATRRPASQA
jgi:DNA-binding NarL/FixJ family response regulator